MMRGQVSSPLNARARPPSGSSCAREGRRSRLCKTSRPSCCSPTRNSLKSWTGKYDIEKLAGEGFYTYLVRFQSWSDLDKAKTHLQKASGKSPSAFDAPYFFLTDPVAQHLMLTGQTHFLGMAFEQLKRLQLDIETYTTEGFEFPNPGRPGDRIIAIALADQSGWERIITGHDLSEPEMLEELTMEIRRRDPDVIEGHNLFRFDLEYIAARARRHRIQLNWGRDGSVLHSHASRMNIAERTISYRKYEVFGRHIADTWMLAQLYDIGTRDMESYGLKDVARHFGVAAPDRTYIQPERVSWYFDHDPDTLFRYALDDVRETRAISDILSPSYFVQAQIFPLSYQNTILRGNATKIDLLFMREYLRQRHAIHTPSPGQAVSGGFTDCRYQGVVHHVLHCDITSLYPSIMLSYECFPAMMCWASSRRCCMICGSSACRRKAWHGRPKIPPRNAIMMRCRPRLKSSSTPSMAILASRWAISTTLRKPIASPVPDGRSFNTSSSGWRTPAAASSKWTPMGSTLRRPRACDAGGRGTPAQRRVAGAAHGDQSGAGWALSGDVQLQNEKLRPAG